MNRRQFLLTAGATATAVAHGEIGRVTEPNALIFKARSLGMTYCMGRYYHMGIDTAASGESVTAFRRIERRLHVKEDGAIEDEWVETANFVLDKKMDARYFEDAMKNFRAHNATFSPAAQNPQGTHASART